MISGNFKDASYTDPADTGEDVSNDPDFHSSDRRNFFEQEAAVDFGCAILHH
jgi:hypothetical protein